MIVQTEGLPYATKELIKKLEFSLKLNKPRKTMSYDEFLAMQKREEVLVKALEFSLTGAKVLKTIVHGKGTMAAYLPAKELIETIEAALKSIKE